MAGGSSPRVWGQEAGAKPKVPEVGIIPTRVGTRPLSFTGATLAEDHPHACGDKLIDRFIKHDEKGSSPRVWGQAHPIGYLRTSERIIPTRVGTRIHQRAYAALLQDHPHACGDKLIDCQILDYCVGSSPRVWGQAITTAAIATAARIIPTRVGTRMGGVIKQAGDRDHPHACGDKFSTPVSGILTLGSSPRVWGQDRNGATCVTKSGIIPTRVGTRRRF